MAGFLLRSNYKNTAMRSQIKPLGIFLTGMLSMLVIFHLFAFNEKEEKNRSDNNLQERWSVPDIPAVFDFAGEKVPLERPEVKEYFDRNFTQIYYQTGTMLNVMKLANRWFPIIEER